MTGQGWQVLERAVYRGPSLHARMPMVRLTLDLRALGDRFTDKIPGFADRLLAALPALATHHCSTGAPGGFVARLRDGTLMGHVVEHVALALQAGAGAHVTRGKTRAVPGRAGCFHVLFAYEEETVALAAGRLALQLVDSLLPPDLAGIAGLGRVAPDPLAGRPCTADAAAAALARIARRRLLGPTTRSLAEAATRRGIPVARQDEAGLLLLGQGRHLRRLRASISDATGLIAAEAAADKGRAKALLAAAAIPVPQGVVAGTEAEALAAVAVLGWPLVVKPIDGNHGRGVTVGVSDVAALQVAYAVAARGSRRVIIERMLPGCDHRLLVVGGDLVAAARREPAAVVGDGIHDIGQLITRLNADPRRGDGHAAVLTRVRIDAALKARLAAQGLSLTSVPLPGVRVVLAATANLSAGGTATDCTDAVHPDNALIARRAALTLGLDIAGIDFICPDIARSVRETGGGVVEVNTAPGFRMHLAPSHGRPRDVAAPVIAQLFPGRRRGRVPLVSITGTNGKSTTCRMVAHLLAAAGRRVGLTSSSGVAIDGRTIMDGDASGPRSARLVLRDPLVEAAVLETARGGILREGLGYALADVGCVLNVAADHLGMGGIETLRDLARVKAVVATNVDPRGTTVLNADDPAVLAMRRRAGGRIGLFSLHGGPSMAPAVAAHIVAGGLAAVREAGPAGGQLVIHEHGRRQAVIAAAAIPATMGGAAEFNIANALAAIAVGRALRLPIATMAGALARFDSTFEVNPGRLNRLETGGVTLILDYAHNAAGLTALGGLVDALRPRHRRVLAMLAIPGDRRDTDILALGRAAAPLFDMVALREDPGRRGRPPGEVLALLAQGLAEGGMDAAGVLPFQRESQAVEHLLAIAQPGDLVVLMASEVEAVWARLHEHAASCAEPIDA